MYNTSDYLKNKKQHDYLYRIDTLYGNSINDPLDVMTFETYNLGNCDIADTLAATILKNHPVKNELIKISHGTDELSKDQVKQIMQNTLDAIADITGKRITFVLWLTTMSGLQNVYWPMICGCYDEQAQSTMPELTMDIISKYPTSDIILSDIGLDGYLFGYETAPEQIEMTQQDMQSV